MIPIDITRLRVKQAWHDAAAAAELELLKATDRPSRRRILEARARIWSAIKDELAAISGDKCWYCESKQDRSDMVVDHFRPKGRVSEAEEEHEGYWWLAFQPENYRFSCTYCNSHRKGTDGRLGGKQDHFPLVDESKRVHEAVKALLINSDCDL